MNRYLIPLCGALLLTACSKKDKTSAADSEMTVDTAIAMEDSITIQHSYPAVLYAAKAVDIVGRVNGTLLRKLYTGGDFVRAGQPLFIIESTTYVNAAKEAEASLATAQSEYAYAKRQYEAMQKALKEDAVAEMEVLKAKSSVEQAEAAIRQAKANISDARTNVGYCTVRAPFSGYINDAVLNEGAYVSGEVSPVTLATIYDTSVMSANFNVTDKAFIDMFTSRDATLMGFDMDHLPISFSDPLAHSYTARLNYKDPAVDISTGTLLLKAEIKNTYNELKAGMYATLSVPYRVEPHAVLVLDAAISSDQRGSYMYVVNDSDVVVYTPVTAGEVYQDSLRVIEKGITPGTRYVTKALLKVRPGMKVKVAKGK